jgi:OOP family OmpA-OmpF porin
LNTIKKTFVTGAFTLLAAGAAATNAEAANLAGWYAGVDVGGSDYRRGGGSLDDAFANQGLTTSTSMDKRDTAYQLNLGYRFNPYFALEGGYVDFGRFDFTSNVLAPAADTVNGNVKAYGTRFSAVGILPLQSGFSVYGKAGMFDARTKIEGGSPSGLDVGESHHHTDGTFGVGASYDITKQIVASVEWNRYLKVSDSDATGRSDIDLVTAGLSYHF